AAGRPAARGVTTARTGPAGRDSQGLRTRANAGRLAIGRGKAPGLLDLKAIREDPESFRRAMARRNAAETLERVLALDEERRSLTARVESLRAEQNRGSKEIAAAHSAEERQSVIGRLRGASEDLKKLEAELAAVEEELTETAARLPNVLHDSVPDGETEEDNEVVRVVGEPPSFDFPARDHVELGAALHM